MRSIRVSRHVQHSRQNNRYIISCHVDQHFNYSVGQSSGPINAKNYDELFTENHHSKIAIDITSVYYIVDYQNDAKA